VRGSRWTAIAVALALVTATVPALGPPAAADNSTRTVERTLDGPGDTVVFEITTPSKFDTKQPSSLTAEADLPDGTQRVSLTGGLVHDSQGNACPGGGDDPCFTEMAAWTMEDAAVAADPDGNGDLRVDTGPGLDVALETGHDHDSFSGVTVSYDPGHQSFRHAGTYHLYITVPGADSISANLDVTLSGDVTVGSGEVTDAGFAHWIDDMRAAGTHTALGNAYTGYGLVCGQGCGEVTVPVTGDEQVFGAIGPGQNGFYNLHVDPTDGYCEGCFGPIPATFVGQWGAQWPGHLRTGTGVGIVSGASPNEAIVAVPGASGDTTFFVSNYASLGPQDLVASGFVDAS